MNDETILYFHIFIYTYRWLVEKRPTQHARFLAIRPKIHRLSHVQKVPQITRQKNDNNNNRVYQTLRGKKLKQDRERKKEKRKCLNYNKNKL